LQQQAGRRISPWFLELLATAPHHVVLSIHFLPSAIVPPTIKAAAPRISSR
jgi:hypothetical protein